MKKYEVNFQPSGVRGEVSDAKSVLEASRELGVDIESLCGGVRTCGKCKVKLIEGALLPFTEEESKFITERERDEGYRLGCAAQIRGDVSIFVPEESCTGKQVVRKAPTVRSMELTIESDFQKEFINALQIPHMRDPFPHLRNILREEILLQ